MNYYDARERKDKDGKPSGKWHYTAENDGRIYPVGYCAAGCPGHDTPEEAREHYRQYLLDNARYDANEKGGEQYKCAICEGWTQGYALVGGMEIYRLCDVHRNRERLEAIYPKVGQSVSSY